eukprot:TRINITY_DN1064_c0_g1_i1.p1 TRINITY_DN1064_c0_g1~~TRINITY_DN1064_c0_g1_i1.p1  ORF type:complete len:211 (-),score=66.26 TRINITY_DN1064_c0_g1_i1:135-767(-)
MAFRLFVCLVLLTIVSFSFAEETVEHLKAQLTAKNAEIKNLKAQLQDCDLGSLLQKKGKEVADQSAVYFNQGLVAAQKAWAQFSELAVKYGTVAAVEAQKYSALAGAEINKLAKQYNFDGQLDEADKTWRNLVKTSVNQISESVPQTGPYLKPVKENPVLFGQALALFVAFWFLVCCCRCCCRGSKTATPSTPAPKAQPKAKPNKTKQEK